MDTRIDDVRVVDEPQRADADRLLAQVYDELRRLAAAKLAHERPGQTLTATALVHEAYLRLQASPVASTPGESIRTGRARFFAAAAESMRRILIERARQKRGPKRGGGHRRVELSEVAAAADESPDALIDLDDALTRLAVDDLASAEIAKLRVFAGLSVEEAAEALGISRAAAYRNWTYARAWLRETLGEAEKL